MDIKKLVNYAYNGALRIWADYEEKLEKTGDYENMAKIVNDLWNDLQDISKLLHFLENNNF